MRAVLGIAVAAAALAAAPRSANARCKGQSPDVVVQKRAVGSFSQIAMGAPAELIVRQGTRESLTIRADRKVLPYLKTPVTGGKLELDLDNGANKLDCIDQITFEVTVVNLSGLDVSGAGKIVLDGLRGKRLSMDLGGAATVRMDRASIGDLDLSMSGAVKMNASGQAARQTIRIAGTGQYSAERLASQTTVVSISGTGHARVNAQKELDATISGIGHIEYGGNPRVKQRVSGTGSIERIKR
jgi:hypothetical protein